MTRQPTERAWIGIGANLGDAAATVSAAIDMLSTLPQTRLVARSSLWRTAPVGAVGPDFINAVVALDTTLDAHSLLRRLLAIEAAYGRQRPYPNAPRTLDLDLLLFGTQTIADAALTVPHPRLHLRAFVLAPLAELDAGLCIPGRGAVRDLRAAIVDQPIQRIGL